MAVKLTGQHRFDAPREAVWRALNDPGVLSRTLPGCEQLEQVEPNHFRGALNMRVGPVQGSFQGEVRLSELDPPQGYRLQLNGSGPAGFVEGSGRVRLEEDGAATDLHYEVDTQVGGRLAGVGQRLLDSSARVITRQALEGLGRQIEAAQAAAAPPPAAVPAAAAGDPAAAGGVADRAPGPPSEERAGASPPASPAAPVAPPPAPTQAEFAAGFVRGLLADLIPPQRRPLVLGAAAVLLALVVFLLVRACGG